jgi:hypothetical protein
MRASSNAARNEGAILGVAHGLAQGMQLVASTIPKAVKSLEAKLDASVETITATVEQGSAAIEAHVSAGNAGLAAHITTGNAGLAAHITAGFAGQIRVLRATEDRAEAARAQDRAADLAARAQDRAADLARQRAAEDLAMATTAAGMGRTSCNKQLHLRDAKSHSGAAAIIPHPACPAFLSSTLRPIHSGAPPPSSHIPRPLSPRPTMHQLRPIHSGAPAPLHWC